MVSNRERIQAKMYFIKDVEDLTRRDRQTLRRWWEKGIFPKPRQISNRLVWSVAEIDKWLKSVNEGF